MARKRAENIFAALRRNGRQKAFLDWSKINVEELLILEFLIKQLLAGFSLTFEVEGHCLVGRQVPCETEGRRPETVGGVRGHAPPENF